MFLSIKSTFTVNCKQRGKLDVVADDGRTIYVTLGDGAVFGEVRYLYFEMGQYLEMVLYLGRCGIW